MTIVGISDEIHEAVYELLTGDVTLTNLVTGGIHDEVPQNRSYPFVQMGSESFESKRATFSVDGRNVLVRIHVWSQYQGAKEAWNIIARIGTLLDETTPAVDGAVVESCEVELAQVLPDPDGITRHGVMDLRVLIAES